MRSWSLLAGKLWMQYNVSRHPEAIRLDRLELSSTLRGEPVMIMLRQQQRFLTALPLSFLTLVGMDFFSRQTKLRLSARSFGRLLACWLRRLPGILPGLILLERRRKELM